MNIFTIVLVVIFVLLIICKGYYRKYKRNDFGIESINLPVLLLFTDVLPSAKYGAASELLRHSISEATACSMFCKGEKCKYEDVVHWKEEEMEIKGLYSNWLVF